MSMKVSPLSDRNPVRLGENDCYSLANSPNAATHLDVPQEPLGSNGKTTKAECPRRYNVITNS